MSSPLRATGAKARRFNVGLTIADVILIEDALALIAESDAAVSESAKSLRARIHTSVEKQTRPKKKPPRQPAKRDAMSKRLPGSFESAG